jgi:hypothetical protein
VQAKNSWHNFGTRAVVKEGWLNMQHMVEPLQMLQGGIGQTHAGHGIKKTVCSVAPRIQLLTPTGCTGVEKGRD